MRMHQNGLPRLGARGWRRLVAVALTLVGGAALAAPPAVALREVASGLSAPLGIVHARDGSGRLFLVEKGGLVKVLRNGAVLGTPFLDATGLVSTSGERGLLGLAFHPRFAFNRRFYVCYTRKDDGAIEVSEFLASTGDPDAADPDSRRFIISVPHSAFDNHNGGHIAFGPDGHLYIATGDGGGGGDPGNNGQTLSSRLGKLLRIDVNTDTAYLVPSDNPFVGQAGVAPEIWAYGLRNPWRFSFDRLTGDLFIGDVGQGAWEEIDFEPAGDAGGRNYGWRVFEGTHCFNPSQNCALASHAPPILEYGHGAQGGRSVTGGYRYRGKKSRALRGYYVYGDFISNRVWAAQFDGGWTTEVLIEPPSALSGISSFGEDEAGELYAASLNTGRIYALDAPGPGIATRGDFNGDGRSDILWRNAASGENYLYVMDGKAILPREGYLRAVPDQAWRMAGVGDFDGDGKADILWRNSASGQNYVYFMDGKSIKPAEGYLRTVADLNWQVSGVGDFDGDGKDDILWRNTASGENYLYPMDGLAIKPSEGYLRTVADQNWRIAGVADFDADGMADIVWRNADTGENYLYPMNGRAILGTEGYLRTVADTSWQVKGTGDYDGDGKADVLWRNAVTGENYLYPMDGRTIKPTEGYLRHVLQPSWQVQNP